MYRIMTTDKLKVFIRENKYFMSVVRNSISGKDLEDKLTRMSAFNSICLIDTNWMEVYIDLKGGIA